MEKPVNLALLIGGIGLLLYAISAIDWPKVSIFLHNIGLFLAGMAALYLLSRLK